MPYSNEELMQAVAKDIRTYEGIWQPARAGILEQFFVRTLPLEKLHPNPDDEFCHPNVGPSFRIISEYADKIRRSDMSGAWSVGEPLIVEKMKPNGYMILNGHHRWAAAWRMGLKKVPVRIINLTHESDLKQMLSKATGTKRVVFDLDEVVFCQNDSQPAEKIHSFLFKRIKVRVGLPLLAQTLRKEEYDIWVYTNSFHSVDSLKLILARYHFPVTGIVSEGRTGKGKKSSIISQQYKETIHVDLNSVLRTFSKDKDFDHVTFEAPDDEWAAEVLRVIHSLKQEEK